MAISKSDLDKYKSRVQNSAQQDLYSDINFQNAELFKQNIRSQQIQQGLSFNSFNQNLKRQINNQANRILYEQQGGLTGSSALRQMIETQQQAGTALAQTSNSYAQSQQQANQELNQANLTEQQLQEQYTTQEATKAYQEDLQQGEDSQSRSNRISSAIFGGLGALGAVLSFIPFTAPIGLALDVISGVGMVGTDIYNDIQNPSGGNITQTILDTGLAGLSLIPGVSALRSAEKPLLLGYTNFEKEGTTFINSLVRNETTFGTQGAELSDVMANAKSLRKAKSLETAENIETKIPNKLSIKGVLNSTKKSIIGKSTYDRSLLAGQRFKSATSNVIGARQLWNGTRSVTGTIARGLGRGAFLGGTHYITNNILNNYLSNDNVLNTTRDRWQQIFDQLNIPPNLRPRGL